MNEQLTNCSPFVPFTDDGPAHTFDPAWRSETVLALARAIEAENAFDRLPILADALQEGGCDDEVLLGHCRECEWHGPWCWALGIALNRPDIRPVLSAPEPVAPQPRSQPQNVSVESNRMGGGQWPSVVTIVVALGAIKALTAVVSQSQKLTPEINSAAPTFQPVSAPEFKWTPPETGYNPDKTYERARSRYLNAMMEYQLLREKQPSDPQKVSDKFEELLELSKRMNKAQVQAEAAREQQRKLAEVLPPPESPTDDKPK